MKKNQQKKKTNQRRTARKRNVPNRDRFGPITTVNTAPVAIGNSLRGSRSVVVQNSNGVRVCGREYMFPVAATGSIATWCTVGGAPLTPAVFADSILRQYVQMYNLFKFKYLAVHYITSAPTSQAGEIMFYHSKNRNSVYLSQTSANLLPYVLSDDDTVIGPIWTNHSAELKVTSDWKSCDYGMSSVMDDFADGDVFILSRTPQTTTDSTGYVLFDYEIEFKEQSLQPRLLSLPITRGIWTQVALGTTANFTGGSAITLANAAGTTSNTLAGTPSLLPTGHALGDVYKIIIDATNSGIASWTNGAGLATVEYAAITSETVALADGTTIYGVCTVTGANGDIKLYPSIEAAMTNGSALAYSASAGTASSCTLQVWMSFVGSVASSLQLQPNY